MEQVDGDQEQPPPPRIQKELGDQGQSPASLQSLTSFLANPKVDPLLRLHTFINMKSVAFELRLPNQESAKYLNRENGLGPAELLTTLLRSRQCNQLTANTGVKLLLF